MPERPVQTPSQAVGPFFHLALDRPAWAGLAADGAAGERIVVEGRVIDGDGEPVADACLELWQANAAGRYAHPDDTRSDKPLDPHFRGSGRVATGADRGFRVTKTRRSFSRSDARPGDRRQRARAISSSAARPKRP